MSRSPLVLIAVGSRTYPTVLVYLLEQEVIVGQCGTIGIKIVARFLHAMSCDESIVKASQKSSRDYLLSLGNKRRHNVKRMKNNSRGGSDDRGNKDKRRDIVARIITFDKKIAAPQLLVNTSDSSSPSSAVHSPVSETSSDDSTVMPTSSNETFRFAESHPPPKNRSVQEAAAWLRKYFPAHASTFVNYSGVDLMNLTRQELIDFCGPLEGIRMYNEITEKTPTPAVVIYCALENDAQPVWKMVRIFEKNSDALTDKLLTVFNLPKNRLHSVLYQGPRGIHVLICDDLVSCMEKDSVYLLQILKDSPTGYFKLLLKPYEG